MMVKGNDDAGLAYSGDGTEVSGSDEIRRQLRNSHRSVSVHYLRQNSDAVQ